MNFRPIGVLTSCFGEKFGIPRQPGLVPSATATLTLERDPQLALATRGLEEFSHVWIVFVFHETDRWLPLVRPPRLGGTRKVGVFGSRSPHRPNPIGISVVALERVERRGLETLIHLRGGDFLDGTPVLDIKPYVPYADRPRGVRAAWAAEPPVHPRARVRFAPPVARWLRRCGYAKLRRLIFETLAQDPRPAFQKRNGTTKSKYAIRLGGFDVRWEVRDGACMVFEIAP